MLGAMRETERIAEGILIQKRRRHLTNADVAAILGITRQSLGRRLSGDTRWKHDELHKLASAWGITVAQLEAGFGDENFQNHTSDTADL